MLQFLVNFNISPNSCSNSGLVHLTVRSVGLCMNLAKACSAFMKEVKVKLQKYQLPSFYQEKCQPWLSTL